MDKTYLYLATSPANTVFHRRGEVETMDEARHFATQMARYGMRVYAGADIGKAVSPTDVMMGGLLLIPPMRDPKVIIVQNTPPVFVKANGATAPRRGFWSRLFRRQ